jgi:hypothetical protein
MNVNFQSNRPQVKSAPSQNGLKIKVKSARYFKLNKKLCINMNSYFFAERFMYNFIFLDEQVLFLWMKLND